MTIRRHVVEITTDGSGNATGYTPQLNGELVSIEYVKTDFASGVDFTITKDETGETLWTESDVNATKRCYPRAPTHSTAGVAALFASGGTAVNDRISLGDDRVKIVVGSGGDTKTGTFHVTVRD